MRTLLAAAEAVALPHLLLYCACVPESPRLPLQLLHQTEPCYAPFCPSFPL